MSQKGTQLLKVEVKKRAISPTLRFKMWEATGSGASFWWVLKKALQVTKQNKIVTSHLVSNCERISQDRNSGGGHHSTSRKVEVSEATYLRCASNSLPC